MADDEQTSKKALGDSDNIVSQLGDGPIDRLITKFENASQIDDDGIEFWDARDLQELLSYSKWDNFLEVIQKAKSACSGSGQDVENHFADVRKMVSIGSGAEREIEDIRLTRYACYLVAQNGDARKTPVAFAQTYFAIQTRKQEIADEDAAQHLPLSEDQKRILLRDEIKEHNKNLASAAKGAGVIQPIDFAIFQTFGYRGLYGGLDRLGIQRKKGLRAKQNILDHMGSTELAANLFRATQTEEKLRRENIKGKEAANAAHYEVGRKVRETIREIGGTMPENLPPAEDIVKVERRLSKAQEQIAKKSK
ncbi:MAG: DNA damage-inducible protein D [Parvibaculum sp.]|uniref:DNA damage-inducible protein D n=1 Tax=Parvibaculum sp. TaxID=2024848 RepID=UPI002ABC8A27|nr:DNA damage-inducible protein D [Parvibaculum sp.]MDZ4381076.1 DNA damage-inducible protein D [Parvibaculum sp.]